MEYNPDFAPALTIWDRPERMRFWEQLLQRHERNARAANLETEGDKLPEPGESPSRASDAKSTIN